MTLAAKISATVITGFLGAGKTTLIRHLLQNNRGRKIALVINEFGDLGMDKAVLEGCGLKECEEDGNVVELANGCICCTVADEFLPTMEALIHRADPPDHIVIETSGLALPKPLLKAFHWPEIRSRVTVDGVVAVVDAPACAAGQFAADPGAVQAQREADPSLDHGNPLEELFEDQMLAADMVLVNKADLLDEAGLAAVMDTLGARLRPGVHLLATSHGAVDPEVLLGLDAAAEDDLDGRHSHHDHDHHHDDEDHDHDHDHDDHHHDDFESFTVALPPVADPAALEKQLVAMVTGHAVLRVKGILDVPDKPMRHVVQGVGPRIQRYFDRPWKADEARRSELVIIGLHGLDRDAIATAIGAEIKAPACAAE